jgi:hypothetical protein
MLRSTNGTRSPEQKLGEEGDVVPDSGEPIRQGKGGREDKQQEIGCDYRPLGAADRTLVKEQPVADAAPHVCA